MQRGISGYNILLLLSMVDGKAHTREDAHIKKYLIDNFTFTKNLDAQLEYIMNLPVDDYAVYMQQEIDNFYKHSTAVERNKLLNYAIKVIKADGKIVPGENELLDLLYHSWYETE